MTSSAAPIGLICRGNKKRQLKMKFIQNSRSVDEIPFLRVTRLQFRTETSTSDRKFPGERYRCDVLRARLGRSCSLRNAACSRTTLNEMFCGTATFCTVSSCNAEHTTLHPKL